MKINCPYCKQKYDLGEDMLGQDLTCQVCNGHICVEAPHTDQPIAHSEEAVKTLQKQRGKAKFKTPKRSNNTPRKSATKSSKSPALIIFAILIITGIFSYKLLSNKQEFADVGSQQELQDIDKITENLALPSIAKIEEHQALPNFDKLAERYKNKVVPFFEKHCVQCHGPKKEKGSLRVDQLVLDFNDQYSLNHMQNIIDELTTQSMPPEEEEQPDGKEVVEVMNLLTQFLDGAKAKHSGGGGRPVRRLTRTEFINTVEDQLGIHIDDIGLPDDDALAGSFETNAESLYLTDMHIRSYLKKSREVVKRFIASRNLKPETKEVPVVYSSALKISQFRVEAKDVPAAGYLTIRTKWWHRDPQAGNIVSIIPGSSSAEYEIVGTESSPQTIDVKAYKPTKGIKLEMKHFNPPPGKKNKLAGGEYKRRVKASRKIKVNEKTLIDVQDIMRTLPVILGEIKNYHTINPQPYEFFKGFLKNGDQVPDTLAPAIIEKFSTLMKRGRPVDKVYIDKLNTVFKQGRQMGMGFWEAIEEPLAITMCSMDSIMHFENRDPKKGSENISGVELANRLSFTLWCSAPDEELIQLGQSGALLAENVKTQQIARMMKDEKFNRFLSEFTEQWLELSRQDAIAVNTKVHKDFDFAVKPLMKQETIQFMSHLVQKNLSLTKLIDSEFILLNNTLARHYGIPGVVGSEFRVVPRKDDSASRMRGGILTHAGILMQGGTGERTSIVERGAFIARKIIDRPPGTPPPNAGELPTDDADTATMTGGELVKHHASSPQCANCHARIDPLGMGLEGFDAVGMPRTEESRLNPNFHLLSKREQRRGDKNVIKVPLDTKGHLYDGQTFKGVSELKRALMTKKDGLAKVYIRALLSFVNGRNANFTDEAIVENIFKKTSKDNFPARSIIEQVLYSKSIMGHVQ